MLTLRFPMTSTGNMRAWNKINFPGAFFYSTRQALDASLSDCLLSKRLEAFGLTPRRRRHRSEPASSFDASPSWREVQAQFYWLSL